MSTTDIRKSLNAINEAEKKANKVLKENFNDDMNSSEPTTKVEIEFTGAEEAEVEISATGMEEVQRLVDLAGIFHKEKAGTMGIDVVDPTVDSIPGGEVTFDTDPDTLDSDLGGLPTGGPDVPVSDNLPAVVDDNPSMDFGMDPEMMANDKEDEFNEASVTARFDYGNPNENLGQEEFHIDAYNFAGGASKPVRAIPARSGDNPMVDPADRKGLKEYMAELVEELEKKNLSEDLAADNVEEFVAKTFDLPKKNAATAKAIEKSAETLSKNPSALKGQTPDQIAQNIAADRDVKATGGLNSAEEAKMEKNVDDFGQEFDEAKRQYSFKQQVLPFQGLTGTQRLHRNALRKVKRGIGGR